MDGKGDFIVMVMQREIARNDALHNKGGILTIQRTEKTLRDLISSKTSNTHMK
jgi:hypothetical protein